MILASILDQALQKLGGFLPRLAGAIVLLLVGLLLARLLARLLTRGLEAANLDELGERWGVNRVLGQAGLPPSLPRVLGAAVRIGLTVVVLFAALSLLGLQFLSQSLNAGVLLLPQLLVGFVLLLAGLVVAALARDRVDRAAEQMDLPFPAGQLVQVAIVAVFAISAASQIAVAITPLLVLLGIVVVALAGTFTLAFGLGGREVASALSAGRYAREALEVGQTIRVGDVRGTVQALESAATVLEVANGEQIRLPNHLLLRQPVHIEPNP